MPVNLSLMAQPVNWFIITFALAIGAFALHAVLPTTSQS